MKIQYMSDLHIEFGHMDIPAKTGDVLVLAGDIHVGAGAIACLLEKWAMVHDKIIYVHGNHELYHQDIWDFKHDIKHIIKANGLDDKVFVLDDDFVVIDDVTFIGSTLWSQVLPNVFNRINDSQYIGDSSCQNGYDNMTAELANSFYKVGMQYIIDHVEKASTKVVVVSHHAPSFESINYVRYGGDDLNSGYATESLQFMPENKVNLWIHGHTHHCVDYVKDGIHVVSNQRGYYNVEEVPNFDPLKFIEV